MTPAERRAALVERVVDAINAVEMRGQGFQTYERELASAALNIALEEAARVAEGEIGSTRREIAAAILVLIGEKTS